MHLKVHGLFGFVYQIVTLIRQSSNYNGLSNLMIYSHDNEPYIPPEVGGLDWPINTSTESFQHCQIDVFFSREVGPGYSCGRK